MTPAWLLRHAIDPALELLPEKMRDPKCRPFLVTIALQESRLKHRRQIGGGGAVSWWQYEPVGSPSRPKQVAIRLLMARDDTSEYMARPLSVLGYRGDTVERLWLASRDNDILSAAFARCLLWTLPEPLPERHQIGRSWDQYLDSWRPGKPHPETWDRFWRQAWEVVGD